MDEKIKSQRIQEFILDKTYDYAIVNDVNYEDDPSLFEEICDGIEAIITKSLYSEYIVFDKFSLFCCTFQQRKDDFEFEEKINRLQFITPTHLDIDDLVIQNDYLKFAFTSNNIVLFI